MKNLYPYILSFALTLTALCASSCMGDNKPAAQSEISVSQINPDFIGQWEINLNTPNGEAKMQLNIAENDNVLEVYMSSPMNDSELNKVENVSVKDDELTISLPMGGRSMNMTLGLDGHDKLKGNMMGMMQFEGKRVK